MELLTKKLIITDSKGKDINVRRRNIGIYLNDKKTPFTLRDLFTYIEFDEGEIYGDSLLGYYNVTDDGKLSVEGSLVELREDTGEQIKVVKIKRPGLTNDEEISFEEVQKFAHDFSIAKPEEVFSDLNDEEKQVFIAARQKAEAETAKEKAKAAQDLKDAETIRLAKEAEEADKALRDKVKPEQLREEKAYKELKTYYRDKKCTEYVSTPHHIFFGTNEEPCLLVKRGKGWWQEPDQTAFEGETAKEIIIEFDDLGEKKEIVFNSETGEIK